MALQRIPQIMLLSSVMDDFDAAVSQANARLDTARDIVTGAGAGMYDVRSTEVKVVLNIDRFYHCYGQYVILK